MSIFISQIMHQIPIMNKEPKNIYQPLFQRSLTQILYIKNLISIFNCINFSSNFQ